MKKKDDDLQIEEESYSSRTQFKVEEETIPIIES